MTTRTPAANEKAKEYAPILGFVPLDWLDRNSFAAIRSQLCRDGQRWAERIAATVEEDYRQLLEDRGGSSVPKRKSSAARR